MTPEEVTAKRERLLGELREYNEVSGHTTPEGGIVLMLNHKATLDNAAFVHLPPGADCVAFLYDEDDQERNDRVNEGGNWDA